MFVVVDKFKILNVYLFSFENDWRLRGDKLKRVEGFVLLELLRGEVAETYTSYNCQTKWKTREYFLQWLSSENFHEIREAVPTNFSFHHSLPRHECFELVM